MTTAQAYRLLLTLPHQISVHTSGSHVALIAVILLGVVGLATPVLTGLFLWVGTKRIIRAQQALQEASLEAERARLEMTLQAEMERLKEQLSFERERLAFERAERERQELREILGHLSRDIIAISQGIHSSENTAALLEPAHRYRLAAQLANAAERARDEARKLRLRVGDEASELLEVVGRITDAGISARLALELLSPKPWARNQAAQESLARIRTEMLGLPERFTAASQALAEAKLRSTPSES